MQGRAADPSVILSERSESKDLFLANLARGRMARPPREGSVELQPPYSEKTDLAASSANPVSETRCFELSVPSKST
jgi:hypothetical protein